MTVVSLSEYETKPAVPLAPEQCDQIRRLTGSISITPTIGMPGMFDLTAGSYVGVIRMPGLEVTIRPKIDMQRLLFLLAYGMGNVTWLSRLELAQAPELPEAIVPGFVQQVEWALRRGVLQTYRSEDDTSLTVRGRWRVGDQIRRRYGVAPPAEITFDDFTVDNDFNRVLLAATLRLQRMRLRSEASRARLQSVVNHLEGVSAMAFNPRRLPKLRFDRINNRYQPAVKLSLLILGSTSFDLGGGNVPASAFLVDMNKAFEDFVVAALRDELRMTSRQLVQGCRGHALYLDQEQGVRLKPDISVWIDDNPIFVADVKYKRVTPTDFPEADVYQATAYAVAMGLDNALLIYAQGATTSGHTIVNIGKQVDFVRVDVSGTPDEILASIRKLADRIRHAGVTRKVA